MWDEERIRMLVVESVAARRAIINIPTIQEGRAINAISGTDSDAALLPNAIMPGIVIPTSASTTQG